MSSKTFAFFVQCICRIQFTINSRR